MIKIVAFVFLVGMSQASDTRDTTVVSQPVTVKAWQRQKVLVKDGELVDASGTLVAHADAVAHAVLAANVTNVATTASTAVAHAGKLLTDSTNQIPGRAYSYSLHLEPVDPRKNLTAHIIDWSTDGTTDVQLVRYSLSMQKPPNRTVKYRSANHTATAKAEWDDWRPEGVSINGVGGYHRCTILRPSTMVGLPCLTISNEVLGGDQGFAFGSMTVMIDGLLTFSGVVTNGETVLTFDNGVLMR